MDSFLVNYGGPDKNFSSLPNTYEGILTACKNKYDDEITSTSFIRKGLNITYYQVGIHRMIKVELPKQPNNQQNNHANPDDPRAVFRSAKIAASNFNARDYHIHSNNCVTAVANVLNTIDPSILNAQKKILPSSLDQDVENETMTEAMLDELLQGSVRNEKNKHYARADDTTTEIWHQAMSDQNEIIADNQRLAQQAARDQRNFAVASKVWNEVMTPVSDIKATQNKQTQQAMKGKMQSMQSIQEEQVDTPQPKH